MYCKFLILTCLAGALAVKDYSGYKVLRVSPPDESSLQYLRGLESQYDFWSDSRGVGHSADIMVSGDGYGLLTSTLKKMGFSIETMIGDMQPLIDDQMKASAIGFDYYDYHTMPEIEQWMKDFTAENPGLVQMEEFATTYYGRRVSKIKISSDFSDTTKPIFFMIGGTHAREWICPAALMNIANMLVQSNGSPGSLLDLMEFHIVPVFNQDGYDYTWTDDRMWRKTRSPNADSICAGTDPNRNFDCQWNTGGSSSRECSQTYMGTAPASEIEIAGMQEHVFGIRDRVKVFMDVHAYSQYWMYPYGYSETVPADDVELRAASKASADAVFATHGKNFEYGPIANVIYIASGSSADWGYDVAGIKHSYALELRDTGEYGFLLPASQILPTTEEFYAGCEALVHYLRDNGGL
ncbi:M14 family metallopeptidase [Salmonella sp. s54395]|uniref:M14 family metallopeptidase n=1 Tax=Salmonella sp. s54395 TaxID=3159664 RepID=UPI00397F22D7